MPATCTTAGKTEGSHCSVCNAVIVAQTTVTALGHNWSTDPYKCSRCPEEAEKITVYFQNNWLWSDVTVYYWYDATLNNAKFPGKGLDAFDNDGTYDYYKIEIPDYVIGFVITGKNHDETNRREQTTDILLENITDGHMYKLGGYANGCDKLDPSNGEFKKYVTTSSQDFNTYKSGFTVIKFKPNSYWKTSGRYAAYIWKSSNKNDNKWLNMSDFDKDGYYSCWVPNGYDSILFARMNANTIDNNFNSGTRLNQTKDLKIANFSDKTYTLPEMVYLDASYWDLNSARFAAYFFGNGEKWVDMTDIEGDGILECEIPSGFTKVIFCRMNKDASANNWNNKWNQTGDLTIQTNGNMLFTITQWDGQTTGWSKK